MKKILLSHCFLALLTFVGIAQPTQITNIVTTGGTPNNGVSAGSVVNNGTTVYFRANNSDPSSPNFELWKTGGTAGTTSMVKEINASGSAFPNNMILVNSTLYFSAADGFAGAANGNELWKSDGTSAGTVLVKNIAPSFASSDPSNLVQFGTTSTFYFTANDGTNGVELWKSDGTTGGTVMVSNINAGANSSNPSNLYYYNNKLYFSADDGLNGYELWSTDGTTTAMVKNIHTSGSSNPSNFIAYNGSLYFSASDGVNGVELWRTDGTNAGTVLFKNFTGNSNNSNPSNFVVANNVLYMTADNGSNGNELWKTTGTLAGTVLIDIASGSSSSSPSNLINMGEQLYFAANYPGAGIELMRYDGSNYFLVKDIETGSVSSGPENFTNAYGILYFTATTTTGGTELWKSDGTAANTVQVADINPGTGSSEPSFITVSYDKLIFFADNGTDGSEPFRYTLPQTPALSHIADQTTNEDIVIPNLYFTLNHFSLASVTSLVATSSNTTLIPNANLVITGSGTNRYLTVTPGTNQFGTCSVYVTACDAASNCKADTFTVTINSVDDNPFNSNFTVNVTEDNSKTLALTDFNAAYFDVEGSPLTYVMLYSLPVKGTLILNVDTIKAIDLPKQISSADLGLLTYVPSQDLNGLDSAYYQVYDGALWSTSQAKMYFNIAPVNDAPIMQQNVSVTTLEDIAYTFSATNFNAVGTYYDVDPDPLASINILSLPTFGKLIYNGDTLKSTDLIKNIPAANIGNLVFINTLNYNGQTFFRITASDGITISNIDTVFINLTPVNDAPVVTDFAVSVSEDNTLLFDSAKFMAAYTDVELTLLNKIQILSLPANGTLLLNSAAVAVNDVISRSDLNNLKFKPDTNYFGPTSFAYNSSDGALYAASNKNVNITVNSVNDAPFGATVSKTGNEDVVVTFSVSNFKTVFTDVANESDTLNGIQITSLPANATLKMSNLAITSGQLPLNIAYTAITNLTFKPDTNWFGTTTFEWKAYDGEAYATSSNLVSVVLSPVNDQPLSYNFNDGTTEDTWLNFERKDFTDNFSDVDFDTLITAQINTLPANGQLWINGIQITVPNYLVSKALLGTLQFKPDTNWNGSTYLTWSATDGLVYSTPDTLFITITPVNDVPVISKVTKTANEDQVVNLFENDFTSKFTDVENDTLVKISIVSLPLFGTLKMNGTPLAVNDIVNDYQIGTITFTPTLNWNGTTTFRWKGYDGVAPSATADTVQITLLPVNDAPTVIVPAMQTAFEDVNKVIAGVSVADVDAASPYTLTVNMSTLHGKITLASTTGLSFTTGDGIQDSAITCTGTLIDLNAALTNFTYRANLNYNGFDSVSVAVNDLGNSGSGGALSQSKTFLVEVNSVNDTTLFMLPAAQTVFEDTDLFINGISLFDADGDNSIVRVTLTAPHGTLSLSSTSLITFITGDGTNDQTLTFRGTINAINPALSNLKYHSNVGYIGNDGIQFTVVDSVSPNGISTDNATLNVTVNPRAVAFTAHPTTTPKCVGASNTLSVSAAGTPPFSYQWMKNGNAISNATAATFSLAFAQPADSGIYTCSITNAAGTTTSNAAHFTLFDKPVAAFTYNSSCVNQLISFQSASTVNATTLSTFTWNMGEGTSYNVASPSHIYANGNTYNVSLMVESAEGCRDTIITPVVITPTPAPSFSAEEVCIGDSSEFVNATTVAYGVLTYAWNFSGGNTSTAANPNHLFATPGNYTVSLTAYNNGGCSATTSKQIKVNPKPTVSYAAANKCFGEIITFTNNTTVASGTNTHVWYFGDGSTSNNVSPDKTYQQPGSYAIKLKTTTDKGCVDSLSGNITVFARPTANFSANSVCSIDTTQFVNSSTISSGTITYAWNFGDGSFTSIPSPKHYYNAIGNYAAKLVVTSNNACKDSVTKQVVVNPQPIVDFTSNTACFGTSTLFDNLSSVANGSNTYTWRFGDATSSIDVAPIKMYAAAGSYTVKLVVVTDDLCRDSISKTVVVNPTPDANFTALDVCSKDSVSFMNQTTISSGVVSYVWKYGNGVTSTALSPNYKYPTHGNYTVKLIATEAAGCKDSVSQQVSVFPQPVVNYAATTVCYGNTTIFSNQSSVPTGSNTYSWNLGDGSNSVDISPLKSYAASGIYAVKLVATTDKQCKDSLIQNITVHPKPVANFGISNVCAYDSVQLTNLTTIASGGVSYTWNLGNGTSSTTTSFNYLYPISGSYLVKLVATGTAGCTDSITKPVNVFPVAQVSATSSTIACFGQNNATITINTIGGTAPFMYSSDAGANFQTSNQFNGIGSGIYVIHTTDANGCISNMGSPLNISQPTQTVLNFNSVVPVDCYGNTNGQVIVSATGGTVPYSFSIDGNNFIPNGNFTGLAANLYYVSLKDANGCTVIEDTTVTQPATPIAMTIGYTNVACFGQNTGDITVTASGSVGGYQYSINNGTNFTATPLFNGLNSGFYTVVTEDANGCSTSQGITITQPATAVSAAVTDLQDINCFGDASGSISLLANGGTGNIEFSFDGGSNYSTNGSANNLTAGNYSVVAKDANGCTATLPITLSQPAAALTIDSVDATSVTCFGSSTGSMDIMAAGGTAPYSYHVNTAIGTNSLFTGLAAGNYTVEVMDSLNCSTSTTVALTSPAQLTLNVDSTMNLSCANMADGYLAVSGNGGIAPYNYALNGNIAATDSIFNTMAFGAWQIELTDANGCAVTSNGSLGADAFLPQGSFTYELVGNTVVFINTAIDADSSHWDFGDGESATATYPTHLYAAVGIYEVTLITFNACGNDTLTQYVDVNSTGIAQAINTDLVMNVFPVPARDEVTLTIIAAASSQAQVTIFGADGRMHQVQQLNLSPGEIALPIDLHQFAAGFYWIELNTNGNTLTKKFVVTK